MGQSYRIDQLHIVTYKGQKKKDIKDARCRYLAKSQFVECSAKGKQFQYVNFRGSHFKNVDFSDAVLYGCDFWGTSFNKCNFRYANIADCVFMACKFTDCEFDYASIQYSTIVNSSLLGCHGITLSETVEVLNKYPQCEYTRALNEALAILKSNTNIRKNKLLHIPGGRNNELNIYLLEKLFPPDELAIMLIKINERSTKTITTYKKLEMTLKAERKMI